MTFAITSNVIDPEALKRSLVADAALSSAFVPVFSELLEKGDRKRAWRVASTLFWLLLLVLGALTAKTGVAAELTRHELKAVVAVGVLLPAVFGRPDEGFLDLDIPLTAATLPG